MCVSGVGGEQIVITVLIKTCPSDINEIEGFEATTTISNDVVMSLAMHTTASDAKKAEPLIANKDGLYLLSVSRYNLAWLRCGT